MTRHRPEESAVREQMRDQEAGSRRTESSPATAGAEAEAEAEERPEPEPETGPETEEAPPSGAEDAPAGASEAEQEEEGAEDAERPPAEDEDPLARAERERDEYLELAKRTQADFENYRKRAAKEAAAAGDRARSGLIRELLPVVDNLERALASAGEAEEHLAEGVRLVHSELVAALQRNGVEAFDPQGEEFDPTVHEALSTRPGEDGASGVVLDTVEKGYRLNDTVLRPARVVVSA